MVSRSGEVCMSERLSGGSGGEFFLLGRAAMLRAASGKAGLSTGPFALSTGPFALGTARMGAVLRGAVPEAVVVVVVLLLLLLLLLLLPLVVVVVAVAVEVVVAVVVAVAGAVAVVLGSTVGRSTIEGLIISSVDI